MIRGLGRACRGWIMLAPTGKRAAPAARGENILGAAGDIGFAALEPGGAGLIRGRRFAGCRGFAA